MYKCVGLIIALLISACVRAQIPYTDSREALDSGMALYDRGQYKEAVAKYRMVNECDTNFESIVYEEALALQADSAFEDARQLALSGLKLPKGDKRDFMLLLAATYDYLQKDDSALLLYDSLIKMYPNDNQPWYEKGIIYFRKKDYDGALRNFQHSAIINPNHFRSHYMMGLIYGLQGRLSESLIALEASLLMTNDADLAKKSITVISAIVEETDEMVKYYHEKEEKYSDPVFDDLDQIINSKLALSNNYTLKMSLNDNIFRQTQAVMEKLKFDADDTGFVMQYYAPLLTQVFADDQFEPFILLLYSGYGFENVDNLAKKKNKEIAEVKNIVFPYFSKIQSTREVNFNKRGRATDRYHYFPSDNLIVIGNSTGKGDDEVVAGDVTLLRGNQLLVSKGYYNERGEKDGWWTSYFGTGKVRSREFYVKNQERDSAYAYFGNGNLSKVLLRNNNGEITEEYEYDYNGWLSFIRKVVRDKVVMEQSVYSTGAIEDTVIYEEGKIKDGTYRFYFKNGKLKKLATFSNELFTGPYKIFYENGGVSEEAVYKKGVLDGPYKAYYESGQLKERAGYSNGKQDGPYEDYYENGKMSEKGVYNNGEREELNEYTEAGRMYKSIGMKNNVPVNIKYTDEDNKVVYEQEDKNGIYSYPIYYANGNKSADMKISEKGYRDGLITFYFSTGAKSGVMNYKDGSQDGATTTYYKDGNKRTEENYVDNKKDGYFKNYYANGQVEEEGWYKDDKKQGVWRSYYSNGKQKDEKYYLNDNVNGYDKEYNTGGELTDKYLFDYNALAGLVCYDTDGTLADSLYHSPVNGTFRYSHSRHGGKDLEYSIRYGNLQGPIVTKFVTGAVKCKEHFSNGLKDSASTTWFPDGTVNSKGTFLAGDKVGQWQYYNEAGELVKEEYYSRAGRLDGKTRGYACGQKHVEYNFKNGERDGAQTYYGENGRAALILYFDNGDLIGYTYEGKDGKNVPVIKVKNGTAKITAYYQNGQKAAEATFLENIVQGSFMVYYSTGNVAEERTYKGFDLEGPFKRYTPEGKLVYDITYKDDNEEGAERTYDANGNLLITCNYNGGEKHGPTVVTDPRTGKTKTYTYHYGYLTGVSE